MARDGSGCRMVPLAVNTPQRFYRGGERILRFRGLPTPPDFDGRRPEDWLGSTTRLFAEGGDGLTVLPGGTPLPEALRLDPEGWLGADHRDRHGEDPGLLVKLLDAAERLPVHTHPDRHFATRHLGCAHGKTEAWLVIEAEPGAMVWLGFRQDLSASRLAELVEEQGEGLLGALNGFPVARGDAVLVPAGQPHAIGAGIMVVELQEPTDFSVMLEHQRFGLDPAHAWLGLDRDLALSSVARDALDGDGLDALRTTWDRGAGASRALPVAADEFFTAEVLDAREGSVTLPARFSVLVVVGGEGSLTTSQDGRRIRAGDVFLTPFAAGPLTLGGQVTALRCSPSITGTPAPDTSPTHPVAEAP
ncbi:MAG TPA: class I mannose-6-phosphate isomerase [Dermatophilaceae bacterium]|nr:class I mannose-6-phosphate isomerase [Dermatophilaceae bacterium]